MSFAAVVLISLTALASTPSSKTNKQNDMFPELQE